MIADSESRSKWRALVKLALILSLLAVGIPLLEIGWRTVDPERHDEYLRPGLERPIQELLAERSRLIPRMMKKHKIPGVSVALVDREGIIWGAGFGFSDYGRKRPITRDTSFMIGSMSKTFAALAVMCAVRDGSVKLDAPITNYLPEFTINSRFETNPQDKITLRHLLNHTSGMTRENPVGNGRQASYASLADHVNSITNTWLRFPVGSYWEYSGAAFDLVSYLLEVRAQKPFADYLEEKVLQPLNLPNTTVDNRKIEGNLSRAIGHGSRHCKKMPLPSDIPWAGAGGVYSSANDLARFIQFFLNWGTVDGKRFLDVESIVAMYTPACHNAGNSLRACQPIPFRCGPCMAPTIP